MSAIFDEIRAEADAMIARSARGTAKDDGKTSHEWGASLRKVLSGGYPSRKMRIKVAAVAVRAIEAEERTDAHERTTPALRNGGAE